MTTAKRHHYLPQFYLEGFARRGKLWVYDRERREYRSQTPKNTAVRTHYYTFLDVAGQRSPAVEAFLANLEGDTKPIVDEIDGQRFISESQRRVLSVFAALLMVRVPDFEKAVNEATDKFIKKVFKMIFSTEERIEEEMARQEAESGREFDITARDLMETIQDERYSVSISKNERLREMLSMGARLASLLAQMDWQFHVAATGTSFITADNPFTLVPPEDYDPQSYFGVGILTPGAVKLLPLSQRTCLAMLDHGGRIRFAATPRKHVSYLNRAVAANCDRFVIGRDEALVRDVVSKSKVDVTRRPPRFDVM